MMKFRRRILTAALGLFTAVWGMAELPAQTKTIDLRDAEFVGLGAPLFAKNCAVGYCHGSEGAAGRGPRLQTRHWNSTALFNVIHDGIPDTTMPGWSAILSREEIWAVTAYVISLGTGEFEPASGKLEIGEQSAASELSADARRGRSLFFDLTNEKRCAMCHRVGSQGAVIGPELTEAASNKSAADLRRDIVDPGAAIANGFEQTVVVATDGKMITGIQKHRDEERVQLYDTAALPPPLRTFYKDQIKSVADRPTSSMPAGYGEMYSSDELDALIAFLKSGG